MTTEPGPAAVGLVADDVTGANDSAVQFAARGWQTLLALAPPETLDRTGGDGLVATSTDSRAAGEAAVGLTAAAVRLLVSAGVERLFLKIDSTMRGSVAHQVTGALQAWGDTHDHPLVVLCPAYPAMGRTVLGGRALVHGEPLEDGAPGADAVTPVTTSELALLLPGSVHVEHPVGPDTETPGATGTSGGRAAALADRMRSASASVLTVDAATDAELDTLAEAVRRLGPRAVAAGSAGLASAMASAWATHDHPVRPDLVGDLRDPGAAGVVVLVTSIHGTAREQVRSLTHRAGSSVLDVSPRESDMVDEAGARRWLDGALRAVADLGGRNAAGSVVLVAAPPGDMYGTAEAAPTGGRRISADDVARRLARTAAAVLRTEIDIEGVVVVGGDGARALADELGATGIAVRDAVREGMPVGDLVGGSRPGLRIVTKAGGFGGPDDLLAAVDHLQDRGGGRSRTAAGRPADRGRTTT